MVKILNNPVLTRINGAAHAVPFLLNARYAKTYTAHILIIAALTKFAGAADGNPVYDFIKTSGKA